MPISLGFWEWECQKRGDAHITGDSAAILLISPPRLPLSYLVTKLRIQRNDGWGIASVVYWQSVYLVGICSAFLSEISSAQDIPSGSCVEPYLQQELEQLKEENHSLVTELENLKKKDVCCTLRKNDDAVCFLMDHGAQIWAFSSSIKFFLQWSQNFSFFWKLFIHLVSIFVKFVYKSIEWFQKADNFFTHCAMKTPTAKNRKKRFFFKRI